MRTVEALSPTNQKLWPMFLKKNRKTDTPTDRVKAIFLQSFDTRHKKEKILVVAIFFLFIYFHTGNKNLVPSIQM